MKKTFYVVIFLLLPQLIFANIVLPNIFGSNMVLQQKSTIKIWGWGTPSEKVVISGTWDDVPFQTEVNNLGKWELSLKTPMYGGPYEIVIKGENEIVLRNILLGEVWLYSGSSNLTSSLHVNPNVESIDKSNYPEIRFFNVINSSAEFPQQNCFGNWVDCKPENVQNFNEAAYFFAKHINENLKIPVGIINASWAGSQAEAWTQINKIEFDKTLVKSAEILKELPLKTGYAFNGMIAPLAPFKIKGVLWHHGEANLANSKHYDKLLNAMINSWQEAWQDKLPFLIVQTATPKYENPEDPSLLRNGQRLVSNLPNNGLVVISDLGIGNEMQEKNRSEIGLRLANLAMKNHYYGSEKPAIGPKLLGFESRRDQLVLYFDTDDLQCHDNCKEQFEIADMSGVFKKTNVKIKSNSIILYSRHINYPIFARFAWGDTTQGLLKNSFGMPASSFVTDNWLEFKGY